MDLRLEWQVIATLPRRHTPFQIRDVLPFNKFKKLVCDNVTAYTVTGANYPETYYSTVWKWKGNTTTAKTFFERAMSALSLYMTVGK